ncbi:MAG TPA: translocation/assembly module TamB domain-containing protein [Gemmatimonadaceae bacterium]|nr:translocation/assembly module TamB domain-containing protein [Gemmatimonadaceae bacterium]
MVLVTITVVGVLVILIVGAVWTLTNTDIGRDRVRRIAVGVLNSVAHGHVSIGHLDGNLLREIIASDVAITDSAGTPLVTLRRVSARFSFRDLLHKRLALHGVRVDHALVILDEYAPKHWNYERIFPPTPHHGADTTAARPGWGSWIAATDVRLTDSRLILRRWYASDSAIHDPPPPPSRDVIVKVPGGYQQIMTADSVTAWVPRLRIEDPAAPTRFAQVANLRANLALFQPPVARIMDLTTLLYLTRDSLWFTNTRLTLPNSRIDSASGRYGFKEPSLFATGRADPAALADLRFAYPRLPSTGWARGKARVTWHGPSQDYRVDDLQVATGEARASGQVGLHLGDSFAFRDTRVRFSDVDTRLIEQLAPSVRLPRQGLIDGTAALNGSLRDVTVNAELAFDDARTNRVSHVTATGAVGTDTTRTGHRIYRATNLLLTLDSLRVSLVPNLPIRGAVSGQVQVDGSTDTQLAAQADLVHTSRTGTSAFTLSGTAQFAGRPLRHPLVDLTATVDPLALTTAGRFAPALGLQGVAVGTAHASGDLGDLTLHGDLRLTADTGGVDSIGVLTVDGHFDLATPSPNYGYDVTAQARLLDVHAVVTRAPPTTLTASVSASGRGVAPATMQASLAASIQTSIIDSVSIEDATLHVAVADGIAHVDTARLRVKNASADIAGSFGLVAGRTGELTYRVQLDSLSAIRRWLPPPDTSRATSRESMYVQAVQRMRGDTAPTAPPRPTIRQQVERAVGGAPLAEVAPTRVPPIDTVPIRHDALFGHAVAAGVVRGSVARFDLQGRAAAFNVIAAGGTVRRARVAYAWLRAPTRASPIIIGAQLDTVAFGRLALDSIDARVIYHQPEGSLVLLVRQRGVPTLAGGPATHDQEYTANANIRLTPGERTIALNSLALRFDTTFWSASREATIRWDSAGLAIRGFALTNGGDGHVIVDGTIPTRGSAQFHVDVAHFQAGDLAALVESRLVMQGDVSLTANVGGTTRAPTVHGQAAVANAAYNGRIVPDLAARFDYDATTLTAHGEMSRHGAHPFAVVDGHLPIRLGVGGDSTTPRLPDEGPVSFTLAADSAPLELIPEFVSSVSDVGGKGTAHLEWTGSLKHPEISGTVSLDGGSVFIVPLGIRLTDIVARLRGVRDSIAIDSIVARSQGTIRVTGSVDITDPLVPVLALTERADGARVINTRERGWIYIDDSLDVAGPLSAPYVFGRVRVTDGVIYLPNPGEPTPLDVSDPTVYAIADTSISTVRQAIPSPNMIMRNLLMDIDVQIDPQVWVRNKDANVEVFTDGDLIVRTDRRHHAIVLDGAVNTQRGQYTFLTKRFEIAKGTATFIGTRDFDPTVQATALYGIQPPYGQPFNIKILIAGTATKPQITLGSDVQPPLSQSELINYLAFGSTSTSLLSQAATSGATNVAPSQGILATTADAQALTDKMATLAIGTATQQFQGDIARSLDADVFNITTGDTPVGTFNNATVNNFLYGTQFEFGKYFTPTTYVAIQARASNWGQAPPGAVVQTRIGPGLTLEAAYQPIFLLQVPTLTINQVNPTKVFGLFVVKDWRF